MKSVLVLMSGGVDSSVAALKLKELGFNCAGVTAIMHKKEEEKEPFYVKLAKGVCEQLKIKHFVLNFSKEFKEKVIKNFISCYEQGKTPNPCILCNSFFKFGKILEFAKSLNFNYIATGHYAKIFYSTNKKRWLLKKSKNQLKDQSYFLYFLTQSQLKRTLFPLEDMDKTTVKKIAKENNFLAHKLKESQDICFITEKKYSNFIKKNSLKKQQPGEFLDTNQNFLGLHKGIINYTIGQRKGIGLSFKKPMFVKKINPVKNQIILSEEEELFSSSLIAKNVNLISVKDIKEPVFCKAKIRYNQLEQDAILTKQEDGFFRVDFKKKQRAIAKGQAVVFFKDDLVLGGGEIV